jgi:glycerophosphoryl diester phosphodiesterase
MSMLYFIVVEASRVGDFFIPTGVYGLLKVTCTEIPFIGFCKVPSDSDGPSARIPVFLDSTMASRIGFITLTVSELDLTTCDEFSFEIDPDHSIVLRIAKCTRMKGPLSHATPIALPEQSIIGHRGNGANFYGSSLLENTIPSFNTALAAGATGIEIDVQLSADDTPVVNHDFKVEDVDCQQLVRIAAMKTTTFQRSGLCTPFHNHRPTFQQALTLVSAGTFDVELKFPTGQNTAPYTDRGHFINRILRDCEKFGRGRRIFFCTFDVLVAAMTSIKQKKYPILLLAGVPENDPLKGLTDYVEALIPLLKFAGVAGFVLHSPNLVGASEFVTQLIDQGFAVMSWGSANLRQDGIIAQIEMGVRGFVTDNIPITRRLIARFVNSDTDLIHHKRLRRVD